ncbi:hypothetical protein ACIQUQ_17995 [Streptomyces sp. NPDC101118]|uniref:hypothetical protein n=1 Tax=Streptomyces sp. NPDC101118 TaxID=3366109 RepID=UPI0038274588
MVLGRHSRIAALAAAAVLVLTPAAVGCSDDGGGNGGATPGTPSVAAPTPTGPSGPADPAAAEAEVTRNWVAFFDPKTPTEEKVKLLENGDTLQPVLLAMRADPNAQQTSAKVTKVEFTSPTEASVTYDLLVGGTPALTASKGTSVHVDQVWKVSTKTLCALIQLSGDTSVPGC